MSFYRNAEWYYDPTAGEALSNIRRQERRRYHRKVKREKRTDKESKNVEIRTKTGRSKNGPVAEPR